MSCGIKLFPKGLSTCDIAILDICNFGNFTFTELLVDELFSEEAANEFKETLRTCIESKAASILIKSL